MAADDSYEYGDWKPEVDYIRREFGFPNRKTWTVEQTEMQKMVDLHLTKVPKVGSAQPCRGEWFSVVQKILLHGRSASNFDGVKST